MLHGGEKFGPAKSRPEACQLLAGHFPRLGPVISGKSKAIRNRLWRWLCDTGWPAKKRGPGPPIFFAYRTRGPRLLAGSARLFD